MRSTLRHYKNGNGSKVPLRPFRVESSTSFIIWPFRWLINVDDPELAEMPHEQREEIMAVELHEFLNRKKYIRA